MSVTPNFSWPLIEPTDFVTNLPADFETFADDVDADVYSVKQTADAALPETIIDAAGDLIYGTAADTAARLAIGTSGQVLTVNGTATAPEWVNPAGGGKVLQVVSATSTTSTTSTSETFADTNLTASITPSSATSKILVLISQILFYDRDSNFTGATIRLVRNSTTIYDPQSNGQQNVIFINASSPPTKIQANTHVNFNYLDSPSTTSATTYKTQFRVADSTSSGRAIVQINSNPSIITLLEIGA